MSEKAIIKRYQETADIEILGQLYKTYSKLVFGVCMKFLKHPEDAEDATMEIFESCIRSLKRTNPAHFKSWLFIVSKNHCLQIIKKRVLKAKDSENILKELIDFSESDTLIEERLLLIDECLKDLDDNQRIALVLHYHKRLSYKEIGQKMQWDENLTRSYIQNGKRNLRLMIQKKLKYVR